MSRPHAQLHSFVNEKAVKGGPGGRARINKGISGGSDDDGEDGGSDDEEDNHDGGDGDDGSWHF